MDDLGPTDQPEPILILTPPKYEVRKRSIRVIKPDASIELSEQQWKRQRLDVSYLVEKRPPLPMLESQGSGYEVVAKVEIIDR